MYAYKSIISEKLMREQVQIRSIVSIAMTRGVSIAMTRGDDRIKTTLV